MFGCQGLRTQMLGLAGISQCFHLTGKGILETNLRSHGQKLESKATTVPTPILVLLC